MMTGAVHTACYQPITVYYYCLRYFDDPWQHLPKDGYTSMFENILLKDPKITVRLGMDYFK